LQKELPYEEHGTRYDQIINSVLTVLQIFKGIDSERVEFGTIRYSDVCSGEIDFNSVFDYELNMLKLKK
jgi:hypothetical protein